jgi:serine phosphatase RsbU (regulator of sigma subunit)
MRLTNAGHPPAYLVEEGGPDELLASSLPLGTARCRPQQLDRRFSSGARLLLYSDGLVEATDDDGEPFTYERLARTVEENSRLGGLQLQAAILAALDDFVGDRVLVDDLMLLVVERGRSED